MQWAQGARRISATLRNWFGGLCSRARDIDPQEWRYWGKRIGLAFLVFLLLYYPLGMAWRNTINDDLDFSPGAVPAGQSRSVAMVAALIDREVNQAGWVANNPFFMPSAPLDNMPNFQMGLIGALARFSVELRDQMGRTRGSSQSDPDLEEAAGLLQYSGTRWVWDPSVSLWPTASSEAQYRKARKALLAYNARLGKGEAVFDKRNDNLMATLDRIALNIGSSSAVLDERISSHSPWLIDTKADDVFYNVKGQMYAYTMILKALRADYSGIIKERNLEGAYDQMLRSFSQAAALDPWIIVNGAPDSQFFPSHLAAQGFYLLRARTQLREVTNILLK